MLAPQARQESETVPPTGRRRGTRRLPRRCLHHLEAQRQHLRAAEVVSVRDPILVYTAFLASPMHERRTFTCDLV